MILYRLAQEKFAKLQASGMANRWNRSEQYILYTSFSISLCALELLAHTNGFRPVGTFKIMHIEVPDAPVREVRPNELPDAWQQLAAYSLTQSIGSDWYTRMDHLLLKVPSAMVPSECNYAINTRHPDFEQQVRLVRVEDFFWDERFPLL